MTGQSPPHPTGVLLHCVLQLMNLEQVDLTRRLR